MIFVASKFGFSMWLISCDAASIPSWNEFTSIEVSCGDVNFANNESLKEMIDIIGEVLEITPKIKQLDMQPGDVDRTYADITKAKKLLGYEPKTTFKEGIQKFVEWYKN